MTETFNPTLLRQVVQDPSAVELLVPRALRELIRYSEQGTFPGRGMREMGRRAVGLVERIPGNIHRGLVFDFAMQNGMLVPAKANHLAFGRELKRTKELDEFDDDERAHWELFIAGLDTSQEISREGAVMALANVAIDADVTAFRGHIWGEGEELVIDRAESVLRALPYHLIDALLRDHDPDDLNRIFCTNREVPSIGEFEMQLETARSPFMG